MPSFLEVSHYSRSDPPVGDPAELDQRRTLSFIQNYTRKVDSLDLSGPSSSWYAPSAVFYNGDGNIYNGGSTIWDWMHSLFHPFAKMEHCTRMTRILHNVENSAGNPCDLLILETETTFWLKKPIDGEGIRVPRLLMFLVGPAEVPGQGTDDMQIWEARAYWDTAVLEREVSRRKTKLHG